MTTKRLSDRERQIAIARLARQNVTAATEDTEHLNNLDACKVACQDYRTWAFIVGYMVRQCSLLVNTQLSSSLPPPRGECLFLENPIYKIDIPLIYCL